MMIFRHVQADRQILTGSIDLNNDTTDCSLNTSYARYTVAVLYFAAIAVYHEGTPEIFPL